MTNTDHKPKTSSTQTTAGPNSKNLLAFTALALASCLLAGCGGVSSDDVEVSLPFVGNVMKSTKATEEKMVRRNGLVLPPKVTALPAPVTEEKTAAESWPDDPELRAKREAQIAAAKDREYRRDGDWKNERSTGNGLEDFQKKIDWSKRQKGIFTQDKEVSDKYRK